MVLLSFDIEEFDAPLEHGVALPFDEQMRISIEGTRKILACLATYNVRATFFCTANFALNAKEIIAEIQQAGHEIASHGYYHSRFESAHFRDSREVLETLSGQRVEGFRMARMMPVNTDVMREAGYIYDASLNPTFIPGRYNNWFKPRLAFKQNGMWQLPAAVTPLLRFPMFWLACHVLPPFLYRWLAYRNWRKDGCFLTYFHPWEFVPLAKHKEWKLPYLMACNTGKNMEDRLSSLIRFFQKRKVPFATCSQYVDSLR